MISKDEVKHIAQLARIGLKEDEIKKFQKELSLILDYIEKLKQVDVSGVDFYNPSTAGINTTRQDERGRKEKADVKKLLKLSPDEKQDFVKVKQVLK